MRVRALIGKREGGPVCTGTARQGHLLAGRLPVGSPRHTTGIESVDDLVPLRSAAWLSRSGWRNVRRCFLPDSRKSGSWAPCVRTPPRCSGAAGTRKHGHAQLSQGMATSRSVWIVGSHAGDRPGMDDLGHRALTCVLRPTAASGKCVRTTRRDVSPVLGREVSKYTTPCSTSSASPTTTG